MNKISELIAGRWYGSLLLAGLYSTSIMTAEIPSTGRGWLPITPMFGNPVKDLMRKNKLPEMTIAIVEEDRLHITTTW